MHHRLTPSQENYLEHIVMQSSRGQIRVRDLANSVGVKLPSVTRAIHKLVDAGMVRHSKYGKIEITDAGKNAAQSVTRRDDCLMRFLVEVLEIPPGQAKSETCRIEHVISEDVLKRLELLVTYLTQSGAWKKRLNEELIRSSGDKAINDRTEVGQTKSHA